MVAKAVSFPVKGARPIPAILWGGLAAGVLDITVAFIRWGNPPRILKGTAGSAGLSWRVGNCAVGPGAAPSDRNLGRCHLLPCQPQDYLSDPTGGPLGISIRDLGLHVHDLGRPATVGVSEEQGSVLIYRAGAQPAYVYVLCRIAHCSRSPPIFAIEDTLTKCHTDFAGSARAIS